MRSEPNELSDGDLEGVTAGLTKATSACLATCAAGCAQKCLVPLPVATAAVRRASR